MHISRLENDYYHFDAVRHRLIGRGSGKIYSIGNLVKICVARVDLDQRQIDFELIEDKKKSKKQKSKKYKKAKNRKNHE